MNEPTTTPPDDRPPGKRCTDCNAALEPDDLSICGVCADARCAQAASEQQEEAHKDRVHRWTVLCPPLYQSTAWTQHPELAPVCREVAKSWWVTKRGIGLGLYGPSGSGKTRAMFEVLKRHHFAGRHVMAIQSMDIEEACGLLLHSDPVVKQDARQTLRRCHKAGILYIDDIGKERMTDPVAREFQRLIEHRSRQFLPTFWTSEQTGDWLLQRIGVAYGDGLIRRLRDFSDIRNVRP